MTREYLSEQNSNKKTRHELTDEERNLLLKQLATLPTSRKNFLKACLNTSVVWIFSLIALSVVWLMFSVSISYFFPVNIGPGSQFSNYTFCFLALISLLFALRSTRNWLVNAKGLQTLIKADLKANISDKVTYQVKAVKCFKEPQLGGLLYLLLLQEENKSEVKIRAIYDYESQNKEADRKALLSIKEQLTICSTLNSQLVLSNTFKGDKVVNIQHFELSALPEKWPKADSWQTFDWESVEVALSPGS